MHKVSILLSRRRSFINYTLLLHNNMIIKISSRKYSLTLNASHILCSINNFLARLKQIKFRNSHPHNRLIIIIMILLNLRLLKSFQPSRSLLLTTLNILLLQPNLNFLTKSLLLKLFFQIENLFFKFHNLLFLFTFILLLILFILLNNQF